MTNKFNEDWRPIPDFKGYHVSTFGRIYSEPRVVMRGKWPMNIPGGFIKTPPHKGYPRFNARRGGKSFTLYVHQVVLRVFIGPPGEGQETRHRDGCPSNTMLTNLQYGTRAENIDDAKRHGTFPLLEKRPGAKLTVIEAQTIAMSTDKACVLGARYGIKVGTVQQIRRGGTWGSVTKDIRRSDYRIRGINHSQAKLTENNVRAIRSARGSQYELADRFGVSRRTISMIQKWFTWKHVCNE